MRLDQIKSRFVNIFGHGDIHSFHSPGRVNLIGEHTDYNGGYVLPCALTLGTYGVLKKRQDNVLRLASVNFGSEPVEISLAAVAYNKNHRWVNYLLGVVAEFKKLGVNLQGMDMLISGNVSSNAGLSSSASIELLMAAALNELFNCNIPTIELVKLCQRAENLFVGVNCGVMDQFVVGMAKRDNAILLNCLDLEYDYIPVLLKEHSLVISNTNSPRSLVDSKYNERCSECENAVKMLKAGMNIEFLGQITAKEFEENKYLISCSTALKRAEHVVYEIDRTKEAALKLSQGDLKSFGKLMNDSHDSLKNLYEVTGFALDTMVFEARKLKGVLGSRMTGAGFGGCAVSLVEDKYVEDFIGNVRRTYKAKTGIAPDFYIAGIGEGVVRVD